MRTFHLKRGRTYDDIYFCRDFFCGLLYLSSLYGLLRELAQCTVVMYSIYCFSSLIYIGNYIMVHLACNVEMVKTE